MMSLDPLPPESLVVVCGMRSCTEYQSERVWSALTQLSPSMVIQGGAGGVDRAAKLWCVHARLACAQVDALWNAFNPRGKAGPIRNAWMLKLKPDYVIAFPGGTGTASMVSIARSYGVEVIHPYPSTTESGALHAR